MLLKLVEIKCFILLVLFSQNGMCEPVNGDILEFKYHNYSAITRFLQEFSAENSDLVSLYSIGRSVRKRELWVMNVTGVNENATTVPNIKLLANIHGNEAAGREILLHFITYLVSSYRAGDHKVKHILDNNRVHILPSLNPDGFEQAKEGKCTKGPGRHNVKDVDLNRSFPDYFRKNTKPAQPETKAIATWMERVKFILSASLHGGAMVANYPFESTKEDLPHRNPSISADDDVFRHLALTYSKNHPKMHLGQECPNGLGGFKDGITNGAAWYSLTGGMQDYNYAMHGCMEVTLEVSCCKYPAADQLNMLWDENRNSLIEYCLQAGLGVKGTIKDEMTLKPIINVNLTIDGRDMNFNTSSEGEFFRILLPGEYKLKIKAPNYKYKVVNFIVQNETKPEDLKTMTHLDIYLKPSDGYSDYEETSTTDIQMISTTDKPISTTTLQAKAKITNTNADYLQDNFSNENDSDERFSTMFSEKQYSGCQGKENLSILLLAMLVLNIGRLINIVQI